MFIRVEDYTVPKNGYSRDDIRTALYIGRKGFPLRVISAVYFILLGLLTAGMLIASPLTGNWTLMFIPLAVLGVVVGVTVILGLVALVAVFIEWVFEEVGHANTDR